mmetsp:Transcript_13191/g.33383  ORF Transcript_13191/g.33383 Transcript_13191/m.33383 type:complete len:215 (+) Transcript_13191:937-1581(+)
MYAQASVHSFSSSDGSSSMPTMGREYTLPISCSVSPAAAHFFKMVVLTTSVRRQSSRSMGSCERSTARSASTSSSSMYSSSSSSKGNIACGQCSHSKYGSSRLSGRQKPWSIGTSSSWFPSNSILPRPMCAEDPACSGLRTSRLPEWRSVLSRRRSRIPTRWMFCLLNRVLPTSLLSQMWGMYSCRLPSLVGMRVGEESALPSPPAAAAASGAT